MPIARYWRISQPAPLSKSSSLEFSEVGFFNGAVRVDSSAALSSSDAPQSGSLANLKDNSTSQLVSFAPSTWNKKGFALTWDFGVATDIDSVRINAGSSQEASVFEFTLQSSSDGVTWDNETLASRIPHAGSDAPVSIPIDNPDPFAAQTVLRLKGEGAEGSQVFTDRSQAANALTAIGQVKNTYADKLVRGPSILVDGNNDGLRTGATSNFDFGFNGDYTIEFFHKTIAYTNFFAAFMASGSPSWSLNDRVFRYHNGAAVGVDRSVALVANGTDPAYQAFTPAVVALGKWTHYALTRQGSVTRIFVDGLEVTSYTFNRSDNFNNGGFTYFFYSDFDKQSAHGYFDEFCVTKGVARYTATDPLIPLRAAYRGRIYTGTRTRSDVSTSNADIKLFTPQNVNTQPRDTLPSESRIDMIFGGRGVINGTVKERSLPDNTPLARRVRLIEERSGYVVAETWSDASTGNYSFANIDRSRTYTVVSYDHTGLYRAVIADRLTPELMS